MKYYIIAGEASGDLHGGNLIAGLRSRDPESEFRFWGGFQMENAAGPRGVKVRDYKDTAVMGLTDVLAKLNTISSNLKFCKSDILAWNPDAVILIDYPGFNMKIAEFCHKNSVRVFYYIAPKTWASREGRNRRLRQRVDKLFIIFPFEIPYFTKVGVPFIYKGNPLVDAIDNHRYSRLMEGEYTAFLPGSRKGEISRMMPLLMKVADLRGGEYVVAGAPSRSPEDYLGFIGNRKNVHLVFGKTYDILKYAGNAVINSGTASLEAALIGTPQVVCWNTSALTYWAAVNILRVQNHIKYISLGNLIDDSLVFRELIQDDFTPEAVRDELDRLSGDASYRNSMLEGYARIREKLGGSGASCKVAEAMIAELEK